MTSNRFTFLFVLGVVLATVLQHAWYWPQLPERVATHFGVDGQSNDWMSRTAATLLLASFQIGMPIFLVGVNALAYRLPDSMLNIPNREYWLSSDRRKATLEHMKKMMLLMAILTSIFLIVVVHLTFLANRSGTGLNLPAFVTALGLYLLIVFGIAFSSMRRFRRPAQSAD